MDLCGLGGLHGLYLVGERILKRLWGDRSTHVAMLFALGLLTWVLVLLAWVFFRAPDFGTAWLMLKSMFGAASPEKCLSSYHLAMAWGVTLVMLTCHWKLRETLVSDFVSRMPSWLVALAWAFMAFAIAVSGGSDDAFIYFQF